MQSPLKAFLDVRRSELPLALLMFFYFFLVISCFWILKPLKKSLFIGYYKEIGGVDVLSWTGFSSWHLLGSQAENLAKVLNMFIAFVAVAVFTLLARRLRRQQLTFIFSAFFMVMFVLYGRLIVAPQDSVVWTFYLFGDLFTTLMVATFFAFLNDSVTPGAAKRLYGLIGLGGVSGGAFGSTFLRVWIDDISKTQWMWICFGIVAVIIGVAMAAGRLVARSPLTADAPAEKSSHARTRSEKGIESHGDDAGKPRTNVAIEGAKLVFRSKYLLSIVAIVCLYEMASNIMEFQFTRTIEHYLEGAAIGKQFATIYSMTNILAMLVQLFLTGFIMTRFGLTAALLVLPAAILTGSVAFIAFPILWVGSLLNTADNGFAYSINQSAKEALYVPTSRDEKYKAKAFIDMFVQRFGKVLAVVINLTVTTVFRDFAAVRYLSIGTLAVLIVWIIAARYAGRVFHKRTD